MDFELDSDQQAILEAIDSLLERHAGPARAIELAAKNQYDEALDDALHESGFDSLFHEAGPLEAALLVDAVARAAGVVAVGNRSLVAAALSADPMPGPIALCEAGVRGPIRYAAQARTLLCVDGDVARRIDLSAGESQPVPSNYGYPMGSRPEGLSERGESLGAGSGALLRAWWRVALSVEAAGTAAAALRQTCDYLSQRKQFGQAIGSFQGVQHRLARCAIQVEGSRWLALEAAHHGADPEAAATAAAYATLTAGQVFAETHQLSGAIGFTREHDLHVWSMRLQTLRLELGGMAAHRRAVAAARWPTRVPGHA